MTDMPGFGTGGSPVIGNRRQMIELAKEIERRGFPLISTPSSCDCVAMSQSMLEATRSVTVMAAVQPIYHRVAVSLAETGAHLHELSEGRFRLGIGVSHDLSNRIYHVQPGQPLEDCRAYVAQMRAAVEWTGPQAPIVMAALRNRMFDLAVEIADGVFMSRACRRYLAHQVARVPAERREQGFFVGNSIPVVIDDDPQVAFDVMRHSQAFYLGLANYRNYWRAVGYVEEMDAIEAALSKGERDRIPALVSEEWLRNITLFGTPATVREGIEAYFAMGIMPVISPVLREASANAHYESVFALYN
ncbi:LLM class flavin-dependent oxidoreductase [Sphingobium sp. AN641]|uniref:LLM class flavin-dependent oxidoreductase n=1 Tax=Sphingobium sp. AN641 TaxID=3133443 RepID=UPI0030BB94CF